MDIKSVLFQEQPYEQQRTDLGTKEKNMDQNEFDRDRDEKVLIYLEWFNLAGVVASIIFAITAIFGFRKLALCLSLICVGITAYLHYFRLHKLGQFRKKWGR